MNSVVRSVLGAALLLTGASAAMAASDNAPAANQTVQTSAPTALAAAPAAATAPIAAPVADQSKKTHRAGVFDNTDPYGGHDPNSTKGTRAFWEDRNQY